MAPAARAAKSAQKNFICAAGKTGTTIYGTALGEESCAVLLLFYFLKLLK
jgi:hypothetical protein